MCLTLDELTTQALQLPTASRAKLADQLVESLADGGSDELAQVWAAEAIRRRDEVRRGEVASIPGPEVIAEARRMAGR